MSQKKFKSLDWEVKDIEPKTRRVTVALSKFGNVDADNDVIMRGAFAKSILERGPQSESNRKIKFLRYHDFEHEIGKWISLEETNDFLIGIGQLGTSTKGDDAFRDYSEGIITEHSIGFFTVPASTTINEDGITELREVVLMEGSAVTFGSNSETPVFEVSKGNQADHIEKTLKKMQAINNALRNGQGTDERLFGLEQNLKFYQTRLNSLLEIGPDESTQENKGPDYAESKVDKVKSHYLKLYS